jgi:hypothetical protein
MILACVGQLNRIKHNCGTLRKIAEENKRVERNFPDLSEFVIQLPNLSVEYLFFLASVWKLSSVPISTLIILQSPQKTLPRNAQLP